MGAQESKVRRAYPVAEEANVNPEVGSVCQNPEDADAFVLEAVPVALPPDSLNTPALTDWLKKCVKDNGGVFFFPVTARTRVDAQSYIKGYFLGVQKHYGKKHRYTVTYRKEEGDLLVLVYAAEQ